MRYFRERYLFSCISQLLLKPVPF